MNDYRIEEFKRLVDKDEYSKYTLTALAELCGFSSRTSFFRYFKKVIGITPNEYIRSIGKTNRRIIYLCTFILNFRLINTSLESTNNKLRLYEIES